MLVLLVSSNAIGQATEPLRSITVKRLLGVQPTAYHVAETGQAPSTYTRNYHTSSSNREDIIIGIRFNAASDSDVEGLLIYNGNTYVMDHIYGENMDTRYITPAFIGDGYAIDDNRQLVDNVIIQPSIFPEWNQPYPSLISETVSTETVTQTREALNSDATESRQVVFTRSAIDFIYFTNTEEGGVPDLTSVIATNDEVEARRIAQSRITETITVVPIYRTRRWTFTATWDGGSFTSPYQYQSGGIPWAYAGAYSWFSEIHAAVSGRGGHQSAYNQYTYGDTVITYTSGAVNPYSFYHPQFEDFPVQTQAEAISVITFGE